MPARKSAPSTHKSAAAAKATQTSSKAHVKAGAKMAASKAAAAHAPRVAASHAKAAAATADREMSEALHRIRVRNDELGTRIDALLARIG